MVGGLVVAGCTDLPKNTQGTSVPNTSLGTTIAPSPGGTPPSPTTTAKTGGSTTTAVRPSDKGLIELEIAVNLVKRAYPGGTKANTECVADRLQREPALIEPAQRPLDQLDMASRKALLGALADCIGPDLLLVVYETTHPVAPDQRDCTLRVLAIERPLQEAIDVVAGEPGARAQFEQDLAARCPGASKGTTSSTAAAGSS